MLFGYQSFSDVTINWASDTEEFIAVISNSEVVLFSCSCVHHFSRKADQVGAYPPNKSK